MKVASIFSSKWMRWNPSPFAQPKHKTSAYYFVIYPGNSLIGFPSEYLIFCKKMSELAIHSKKHAICSFLVSDLSDSLMFAQFWWAIWANRSWSLSFVEQPERFAHSHSFVMSDLSNSLTSLFWKGRMSEALGFLNLQKKTFTKCKKIQIYSIFFERFTRCRERKSKWAIHFKKSEQFAHLLFYHEWPAKIDHGHSFVMRDLSNSLTFALLSAAWAICSQPLICPEQSEKIAHSRSLKWAILSKWVNEW